MSLFRDNGVVLRTYRLGEADRIVVFLTEHHGKVRAVAKGVRRTASKFGGRLEPLSHVALLLWQGRSDLDIVNQAEVIDHFRGDSRGPRPGGQGALARSRSPTSSPRSATPTRGSTRCSSARCGRWPTRPATHDWSRPAFFMKALVLEGAGPLLDGCASCGEPADAVDLGRLRLLEGGALCRQCRRGRPVSPEALDVLRRILGGSLGAVLAEPPPPCADEVTALATEAMEAHLDRRLRASVRATAPTCSRADAAGRDAVRRLRPRAVLPAPVRLLRLRHLHRPRPPDGSLRRRAASRRSSGRSTRASCRRRRVSSSAAGRRRGWRRTSSAGSSTRCLGLPAPR